MGNCTPHMRPVADQRRPSKSSSTKEAPQYQDVTSHDSDLETTHPILQAIETFQGGRPFGRVLDAGTGLNSLAWIAHLVHDHQRFGVSGWCAITASETMTHLCIKEGIKLGLDTQGHLILGNWFGGSKDEHDVPAEMIDFPHDDDQFDTILVDYLVGAMDAFSPFCQDAIFERLAAHLKPGGRLYLLGLEPLITNEQSESLVGQVQRVRDACILLSGERCYREHPLSWVKRTLPHSGLDLVETLRFPLLHRQDDLMDQVKTARWMVHHPHDLRNETLNMGLEHALDELERKIHRMEFPIRLGFDYLVVAEKPMLE
ncbi:MAG: hypothetical protein SGILL_006091 [Bacillariaceae sp.]